jgi:hypothetical protein
MAVTVDTFRANYSQFSDVSDSIISDWLEVGISVFCNGWSENLQDQGTMLIAAHFLTLQREAKLQFVGQASALIKDQANSSSVQQAEDTLSLTHFGNMFTLMSRREEPIEFGIYPCP